MTPIFVDFRLGDVISPIKIKKYAKKPSSDGNVPFVSCQTTNNGIASYCGEHPEVENCITVSTNGNCFDCFYHDYPIVPSSDVEVLYKKGITDDREIALYLCSVLRPFTNLYSYSNKPKNGKVFDTVISLPVIPSSDPSHAYTPADIDWQYMRDRIAELERDRITELDAYLKVTGLDDYELTEEDKKVLSLSSESASDEDGTVEGDSGIRWEEFYLMQTNSHIGLFICSRGTRLTKQNRKFGSIPLLTAGVGIGQGIAQYIDGNSLLTIYNNDITVDMFGESFVHDYPHYGDDNIHFLVNDDISTLSKLYICSVINKTTEGLYSYSKQFRMNILEDMVISLPVTPSGDPDWQYMENYIRAIEKTVIADVVRYKDRVIEETKNVVSRPA